MPLLEIEAPLRKEIPRISHEEIQGISGHCASQRFKYQTLGLFVATPTQEVLGLPEPKTEVRSNVHRLWIQLRGQRLAFPGTAASRGHVRKSLVVIHACESGRRLITSSWRNVKVSDGNRCGFSDVRKNDNVSRLSRAALL